MIKPTRIAISAALLSLSACATVHPPQRGLYLSAGAGEDSLSLVIPSPTPYARSVSPTIPLFVEHAFGWEIGAGYRFNRFISVQAEGMFAVNSGSGADMGVALPYDGTRETAAQADVHPKDFIRPAIRGDLPLARFFSVFATYGLQLEDLIASTKIATGGTTLTHYENTCTNADGSHIDNCKPYSYDKPSPEIGYNNYHHRDWHPIATVGFDLYGSDLVSLHVEYMPREHGRIGATTIGASWHW